MGTTHVRMQVDVRWVALPGRGEALRGSRAGLWGKAQSLPRTEKRYGPLGRIVQRGYWRVGRRDGVIRCGQECRDRRTLERLVGVIPRRSYRLTQQEVAFEKVGAGGDFGP